MDELADARRRRKLKIESAAENVVRHWLTGEVYEDRVRELQRNRSKAAYRKTTIKRPRDNLPTKRASASGHL
jgi:hypothetical protein